MSVNETFDGELWTAIEALDYQLVTMFEHIRNETESMQFGIELEAIEMVEERLLEEFPKLFEGLNIDEVADVRYESFATPDNDEYAGYAIYISFREDLTNRIYLDFILKNPERIIEFIDRSR